MESSSIEQGAHAMMKKTLAVWMALVLLFSFAMAEEDSVAGVLEYGELMTWAESYLARARNLQPLNDPHAAEAYSEDGYQFVYDFGSLWLDSPEMTADSILRAVLITSEEELGPRDTHVDQTTAELLSSYYTENPTLLGDQGFAGIYQVNLLPEGAAWAWVQRDGQHIMAVQYAVQDQLATGGEGYTDAGLIYTIQEDLVAAIRAYGLDQTAQEEDVRANLLEVAQVFAAKDYVQYPLSYLGLDLEGLHAEELQAVPFLQANPEDLSARFGEPVEDTWLQDGDAWLRTMDYGDFEVTYAYDGRKANPALDGAEIVSGGVEGPRGLRIGDSFSSVYHRFRHGESSFDPDTLSELLYGDLNSASWGLVEYGEEADSVIRYATPWENGQALLYLSFDQLTLQDITLLIQK